MKKIILVMLAGMTLLCAGCGCNKKEEKKEEDTTQIEEINEGNLNEEQIVEGVRFKNSSLIVKNETSEFRVTLENTVTTVKKIKHLKINFKDENNYIVKEVNQYDLESLRKGDTKNLIFTFSLDLSNIKNVEYILEF